MTHNDLIRMAREAGFSEWAVQTPKDLERFAALVAAATREACAKVCDERARKAPMGSDESCEAEDCAAAIRMANC
jgi:hypothetical protein